MGNKASHASSTATYTWRIPSLLDSEKYSICKWYIRKHCKQYIPNELIHLFSLFYNNDEYTLEDIKNAEYLQFFHSPIVSINSCKWYLVLYPNGCTNVPQGQVILFV